MARSNRTFAAACIAFGVLAVVVMSVFYALSKRPAEHMLTVGPTLPAAPVDKGTPAKPILYFGDGTNWQLTGIRDYPDGKRWWGADGSEVIPPQADLISGQSPPPGFRLMEIRYRTDADDAFWRYYRFRAPGQPHPAYAYRAQSQLFGTGSVILPVPESADFGDIEIGGAAGPWKIILQADIDTNGSDIVSTTRPAAPATQPLPHFGPIRYEAGRLRVELIDPPRAERYGFGFSDISAITKSGRAIRWKTIGYGPDNQLICEYIIPRTSVGSVVYRTRDVAWITLAHLPWHPKSSQATTVPALPPTTTPSMQ